MKKIALFRKYGESAEFVARFDSVEEASDQVKDIINEDEDANVFASTPRNRSTPTSANA